MRPVGQAVKTPPFHGGNTSSILVRVTRGSAIAEPLFLQNMKLTVRSGNHIQSDLPYPRSAIVFYGQRRFAALPVTVSAVLAKSLERAKGLSILRRLGIGFYTMRSPLRKPSHQACSGETRVYKRLNRFGKGFRQVRPAFSTASTLFSNPQLLWKQKICRQASRVWHRYSASKNFLLSCPHNAFETGIYRIEVIITTFRSSTRPFGYHKHSDHEARRPTSDRPPAASPQRSARTSARPDRRPDFQPRGKYRRGRRRPRKTESQSRLRRPRT